MIGYLGIFFIVAAYVSSFTRFRVTHWGALIGSIFLSAHAMLLGDIPLLLGTWFAAFYWFSEVYKY